MSQTENRAFWSPVTKVDFFMRYQQPISYEFIKDTGKDPHASELFNEWLVVRQTTWNLMNAADKEGLNADSPKIIAALSDAKQKREELLEGCRTFFESQVNVLPTASIVVVDSGVEIVWKDTVLSVKQHSRKLVLISVHNKTTAPAYLEMKTDPARQILFWQKELKLNANETRYLFAYIAPTITGQVESDIYIYQDKELQGQFHIRANSISGEDQRQDDNQPTRRSPRVRRKSD